VCPPPAAAVVVDAAANCTPPLPLLGVVGFDGVEGMAVKGDSVGCTFIGVEGSEWAWRWSRYALVDFDRFLCRSCPAGLCRGELLLECEVELLLGRSEKYREGGGGMGMDIAW